MIERSSDGKTRVLSLSYGKDSMACLGALEELGWPLDRIVTADVWATDTIPADLPPMVEFKDYADKAILERYGIEVEHFYAINKDGSKRTFEQMMWHTYYHRGESTILQKALGENGHYGFPHKSMNWCNSRLKVAAIKRAEKTSKRDISYIGIAVDEPNRFHNLNKKTVSPLVEIGWTEADCRSWCVKNGLISPVYTQLARSGCWFCYNQGVQPLRLLRKQYPDLWALLLKWDSDSPVTFHADGHTVHDFDKRFALEDSIGREINSWRWSMLEDGVQMDVDDLIRPNNNNEGGNDNDHQAKAGTHGADEAGQSEAGG